MLSSADDFPFFEFQRTSERSPFPKSTCKVFRQTQMVHLFRKAVRETMPSQMQPATFSESAQKMSISSKEQLTLESQEELGRWKTRVRAMKPSHYSSGGEILLFLSFSRNDCSGLINHATKSGLFRHIWVTLMAAQTILLLLMVTHVYLSLQNPIFSVWHHSH